MRATAKGQAWRYGVFGMTLIELLVALVIFALLGIMGYRAMSSAMGAREHISAQAQRWRAIANFWQVVENDLTQQVKRPDALRGPLQISSSLQLQSGENLFQLDFLKLDGGGGPPSWRGYRFEQDHITQLRWAGVDGRGEPRSFDILDQVKAARCVVITSDQVRHTSWPDKDGIPALEVRGVELELELADVGKIRRLFAY